MERKKTDYQTRSRKYEKHYYKLNEKSYYKLNEKNDLLWKERKTERKKWISFQVCREEKRTHEIKKEKVE